jgi:hypothetical protein
MKYLDDHSSANLLFSATYARTLWGCLSEAPRRIEGGPGGYDQGYVDSDKSWQ